MANYTHKRIDDMDGAYGGALKRVRAELGVSSFGIAIIDMPPNFDGYPVHDHASDGQEEVYLVIAGGGEIDVDGERMPLDPDYAVRVGAGTNRKIVPGPEGIRLVALGAKPGAVYQAPDFTEVGAGQGSI
jgi:mannose-6-phosphate isomerase-like protein (cupin superfamily)